MGGAVTLSKMETACWGSGGSNLDSKLDTGERGNNQLAATAAQASNAEATTTVVALTTADKSF